MANLTHQFAGDARSPLGGGRNGYDVLSITLAVGTSNLNVGDIWNFYKCTGREVITDIWIETDDLDGHDTPTLTFDFGTDSSAALFGTSLAHAQDADMDAAAAGLPYRASAGDIIRVTVDGVAATGAAGDVTVNIGFFNSAHP
jgi:hypothetical protein